MMKKVYYFPPPFILDLANTFNEMMRWPRMPEGIAIPAIEREE
jgi:hypothetical protein